MTAKGLMCWARSELGAVGKIASVEDSAIQKAYAKSTLSGMAHLKDALYEYVTDRSHKGEHMVNDIQITHDQVVRVMKHLMKEYKLTKKNITLRNTEKILGTLRYLDTRKTKK
jgi:hypothetical protein